MTKLITALAIVTALATPALATPRNAAAYKACLTRVVKAHGWQWAVDHAGATACDKRR